MKNNINFLFKLLLFIFILISCLNYKINSELGKNYKVIGIIENETFISSGYSKVIYYESEKRVEIYMSNSKEDYKKLINTWFITFYINGKGTYELDNTSPPKIGIIYSKQKILKKEYQTHINDMKIIIKNFDFNINGEIQGEFIGKINYIVGNRIKKNNLDIKGEFLVKIDKIVK